MCEMVRNHLSTLLTLNSMETSLPSIHNFILNNFLQVVKLHTKLGKPIPSTEPSMVTQSSSSTTAAPSKTNTATLSTSSNSSSLCAAASTYLKPVNIVSSGMGGVKNTLTNLSAANSTLAGKKVNTPKINFVG